MAKSESLRAVLWLHLPWRVAGARALVRSFLCALAALGAGCASLGSDVHLAPLYSTLSTAGGGRELELLGGAFQLKRARPDGPVREWSVRPLVRQLRTAPTTVTQFLAPFGRRTKTPTRVWTRLFPLIWFERGTSPISGRFWKLFLLPGILWEANDGRRTLRAVFPLGGVLEKFFGFDRLEFVLFPLYMRTQRGDSTVWHFLVPVFAFSEGTGVDKKRVLPFYGHTKLAGSWERYFVLWPLFHLHRNLLSQPEELVEKKWQLWPLFGYARRGSYRAWSFLWPLFGYARNPDNGFWALDAPAPIVRIKDPGETDAAKRVRILPFYSRFTEKGTTIQYVVWPIISWRRESFHDGERKATSVFPIWHSWKRWDEEGVRSSGVKLWPLYQRRSFGEESRSGLLALNPLQYHPDFEDNYSWLWEIYARERGVWGVSERGWFGLWRREADAEEDRRSFTCLWASRKYLRDGKSASETSLLFGLIRWRVAEARSGLMAPAFPGPGWPARSTGMAESIAPGGSR
jgi:hypothetical protein